MRVKLVRWLQAAAREELRSLAKEAEGVAASVGWGRRRGRHFTVSHLAYALGRMGAVTIAFYRMCAKRTCTAAAHTPPGI